MMAYFNQTFDDLLLKESGYFPEGMRPPEMGETISEYIFTRVSIIKCCSSMTIAIVRWCCAIPWKNGLSVLSESSWRSVSRKHDSALSTYG